MLGSFGFVLGVDVEGGIGAEDVMTCGAGRMSGCNGIGFDDGLNLR